MNAAERYAALDSASSLVVGPWTVRHHPDGTVSHRRPSPKQTFEVRPQDGAFTATIGETTLALPTLELAKSVVDAQVKLQKVDGRPYVVIDDLGTYLKIQYSLVECKRLAATWAAFGWEDNPSDERSNVVRVMRNARGEALIKIQTKKRVRTDGDDKVFYAVSFEHPLTKQTLVSGIMDKHPTLDEACTAAEDELSKRPEFWTD